MLHNTVPSLALLSSSQDPLTAPPTMSLAHGRRQHPFPTLFLGSLELWGLSSQGQPCPSSVTAPVLPSLGLTILEVACNMELPHGGEGWQQLRQGYLPPEFTAGK